MTKENNPELDQSIARFHEVMSKVDDITLITIKGHLLIEEVLTRTIALHLFHAEHFLDAKLSFDKKVSLARSLCLRKNNLGEWDMIIAINELRNVLAHNLESPRVRAKLGRLLELTKREAAPGIEEKMKEQGEKALIAYACGHVLGLLSQFEADAKTYRLLIHAMDRGMNPAEPPFEL